MADRKRRKPPARKGPKPSARSRNQSGRGGKDRKPHYTSTRKPHYTVDRKAHYKAEDTEQAAKSKRKFVRIDGLPGNVQEDLARVTPGARVQGALEALRDAVKAYSKGQFRRAMSAAEKAKELAPRDATVREILGLAAYRSEEWKIALRELRTYRRLAGEVTQLPVEMDCLRAMGRVKDVGEAFKELQRRRPSPVVLKEGKVVYGSFLLDEGKPREAWGIVKPGRVGNEPFPEDLRVWFVAGRAAAALGDVAAATKLRQAISSNDPTFEGLALLDEEIARA